MFKLALALGKDVREIARWPSKLISEWMAYDQIDLIPDHPWLAAMIAATNTNLWSKRNIDPEDLLPRRRPMRRSTTESHLALFKGISAGQEAKEKSRRNRG